MLGNKRKSDFGVFGQKKPVRGGNFFRKVLNIVFLVLIISLVPFAFTGWREFYLNWLERDRPTISVRKIPVGLGIESLTIEIEVADAGSGLDEVVIRAEQLNKVTDLQRVPYPGKTRVHEDTITLTLPGKESGFEEGEMSLIVSAFDKSFWNNGRKTTFDLLVDYSRPRIEVLSTQHNAVVGGAELVFYRLNEKNDVFSGVKAGEWLFPGFSAGKLDADFESVPDIHFTFFPTPLEFDVESDSVRLFARDAVGNVSTSKINYRIKKRKFQSRVENLDEQFLKEILDELMPKYHELEARLKKAPEEKYIAGTSAEELMYQFRLINQKYRELLESSLRSIFARPKALRFWSGAFARLARSSRHASFGESRSFAFQGFDGGTTVHYGTDLASTRHALVRAANTGVVIFADDLGIYGNTVIIDHGFGLSTLYAHLSHISRSEGDRIQRGDEIGRTGQTGLAAGDHLHFEIRLHGVPINPNEWWDKKWIMDHIEKKIRKTKKQLGLSISSPLR